MVASISAVAAIWQTAPTTVQPSAAALGGTASPVTARTATRKRQAEGQAEQEADMGRPDRAEALGQAALGGVAEGLGGGGQEGENHPQPGGSRHAGDDPNEREKRLTGRRETVA